MKVGVILPLADDRVSGRSVRYEEVRRWARTAESAGFDSVWIYDHLLIRRPGLAQLGVWESWTVVSALAEATERVELGTWVTCTAFRNPALLAKMAVTLDEVSGGRFILGLGAGNQKPEFDAFGYPFERRVDRFAEALEIIAPLVRGGSVDFRGEHHTARHCEVLPRGPSASGPPILVGADGSRMLRLTARFADLWNAHYLGDAAALVERRAQLREACAAVGRDPRTLGVTVGEFVAYPDISPPPPSLETFVRGSTERISELLTGYERLDVAHVMLQCAPPRYDEALERLSEALRAYRSRVGSRPSPMGVTDA